MKLRNLLYLFLLLIALSANAQTTSLRVSHPKREFRGAWIQAVNSQFRGKSTAEVKRMLISELNSLSEAGINAIIFQVRPEADALYKSDLEPWSRFLTGTQGKAPSPYWDPMEFMIEECRKRGMEFHAWINPYRVKTQLSNELDVNHIYHRRPNLFVTYGNQMFFNPARQESRDHICKVVTDILMRYDVDGIHIDDYFYPYPKPDEDFPDYEEYGAMGANKFVTIGDWRRDNVNKLIEQMHNTIRAVKPWVKFGVSPFGIYRNAKSDPLGSKTNGLQNYDDLYADILLWVEKGWVDYTVPQIYWQVGHKAADYEELVKWWAKHASKRPIYIGQSVENSVAYADPNNPLINQVPLKMRLQRSFQTIEGSCQWYAAAVTANKGGYKDALQKVYHKYPALVPPMLFIDKKAPRKVKKLKKLDIDGDVLLFWTPPKGKTEMDKARRYVVYRFSDGEKVDISRPENIYKITNEPFVKLNKEENTRYKYVVTALDRLHNESKSRTIKVKM